MKTIAVLFGGKSSEYEVSLSSAYAALTNLPADRYNIVRLGITRDGQFWYYCDTNEKIADGTWVDGEKYPVSLDLTGGGLLVQRGGEAVPVKVQVDAVLPMIHGKFCEDGTIQGMFAVAGIPVAGCGCESSAVCMDKALTKIVVDAETGIRQARAVVAKAADYPLPASASGAAGETSAEAETPEIASLRRVCERKFGYPMFVKPARAGSSVGVSKVKTASAFLRALSAAFAEDSKVVIEECVIGSEVEVAVLEENGTYTVAGPAEIDPGSSEFYDYETKYISDVSSYYLPARLSEEKHGEIRAAALEVFKVLECRGFARVDFFCRRNGEVVFNEINTLPGFTPISMYPKMMIHAGISYAELLTRLLEGEARG
ncbi:MAG: D-alanine--D-alanine ligase family protein [Eubacteriales bacterium]